MNQERRSSSRCPVCSGPAQDDPASPGGLRCRNSACRHNHSKTTCPRCKAREIDQAAWRDGKWHYTCADCQHKWTT